MILITILDMLHDSSHIGLGTLVCTKKSLKLKLSALLVCEMVLTIRYIELVLFPEQLSSVPSNILTASVIGG
jgi:hypothetical protein